MNDIAAFLKEKQFGNFVLRSMLWENKYPKFLVARTLSLYGWTKGYFSFFDAMRLLLPARFKSEALRTAFADFLNKEAQKALAPFIAKDGSVMLYGHPFYPPDDNYFELAGLFFELVVADQYQAARYIKSGMTVIDAGANIGSFSVFASNVAKDVRVYAFEPAKKTFAVLEKNIAPYPNIVAENVGLGEAPAVKKFFTYAHSTGGSTFEDSGMLGERHNRENDLASEEVPIVMIDAFVAEHGIKRVDFIKIDTEGYEMPILRGARSTISRWRPVIAVSAYHHAADKVEIPALMASIDAGYVYDMIAEYEEDFIFHAR